MSRPPRIWWNAQKSTWCSDVGGKRITLAKGKRNKQAAQRALKAVIAERELLASVNGAITVARLCEEFLEDAHQNLELGAYKSYKCCIQKLVDYLGDRLAYTIEPQEINRFSTSLENGLNDTSRAIVLRTVERCFNWGVESRLIPPQQLGRIRKPRPIERDRFVTDEEFRALLRETNPKNGHRNGAAFRRLLLALDWTCCRPGELARLKWTHLHLAQGVAILRLR